MDAPTLLAFVFSYLLIALSPGLCMTLSMSLGISIGVRRTLWMMAGEIVGVMVVAVASFAGITALMLSYPDIFSSTRLAAAAYLVWTAVKTWRAATDVTSTNRAVSLTRQQLVTQGFLTATSNPKGWIFLAALLPAFVDPDLATMSQALLMLPIMIVIEFISLLLYASGGCTLREFLVQRHLGHWLHRISATMMCGVALWLVVSPYSSV